MPPFTVTTAGPGQTRRTAAALAPLLRAGDLVLLVGDLACGKTTFVGGVAEALGCPTPVTSPTYTLVHFYSCPTLPVTHVDAYRLSGVREFRDLALEDYLAESATLIEWGAQLTQEYPDHLLVRFEHDPDHADRRRLAFAASGPRWAAALADLRRAIVAAEPLEVSA
jgi:tRNA threonylcarbamoyladenosine biosynthesis protein TsaE